MGSLFIGVAVVVASASDKWEFSVLCIYEVERKIRSAIEEVKNMFENTFFAFIVNWGGWYLFFVEVAECTISCASGSTVF